MDDMVYSLVQGVRITLPCEAETFWINYWTTVEGEGEPIMPSINCQAQMYGFALDPTSVTKFSWEAQIEYLHYLYVPNNQGDYIFSSATQTGIYVGTGGTCTFCIFERR